MHARKIREGNALAPTCTGCHGAHAVTPKTAYQTCVTCHSAALAAHQKWLPNAARHHEVVSCAACHAPAALRMVDLRLYDPATKTWAAEKPGEPWFEKLAKSVDADGNGLDARELLDLVKKINPEGAAAPTDVPRPDRAAQQRRGAPARRERRRDPGLRQLPQRRRRAVPQRHGLGRTARTAGRCATPRSRPSSAAATAVDLAARVLRHRRHPQPAPGRPVRARAAGRRRIPDRPPDGALAVPQDARATGRCLR